MGGALPRNIEPELTKDLRWVEHFQERLNQPNPATLYDFNIEEQAETLDVCVDDIKEDEVADAIKAMKNKQQEWMKSQPRC